MARRGFFLASNPDTDLPDLREYRVFRWLLSLVWVLLWFFWAGILDLCFSDHWEEAAINLGIGTFALLVRMGLGWVNREPRETWFTDLPVLLLRIFLCFLRPHGACAALGMSTGEEDDASGAGVSGAESPWRRASPPALAGYQRRRQLERAGRR